LGCIAIPSDGKEPESSKNESNQHPDFANNRSKPESKNVQKPELNLNPMFSELEPNMSPIFKVLRTGTDGVLASEG